MTTKGREAQQRRAARAERRRVAQKQRKVEQRAAQQRRPARAVGPLQLTTQFLALVPDQIKEQAIARGVRLIDRSPEVSDLPVGYSIAPAGPVWKLVAPAALGRWRALVGGILHPAPQLAAAFAWELVEGRVDIEEAEQQARRVVDELTDRGLAPGGTPKEVTSVLLACELVTGYQYVAMATANDPTFVDRYGDE